MNRKARGPSPCLHLSEVTLRSQPRSTAHRDTVIRVQMEEVPSISQSLGLLKKPLKLSRQIFRPISISKQKVSNT